MSDEAEQEALEKELLATMEQRDRFVDELRRLRARDYAAELIIAGQTWTIPRPDEVRIIEVPLEKTAYGDVRIPVMSAHVSDRDHANAAVLDVETEAVVVQAFNVMHSDKTYYIGYGHRTNTLVIGKRK